ncbi:MAG: protein PhnA [Motiliproteus sp.]|jgi:protein PhnA
MTIEKTLHARSGSKCELCSSETNLSAYAVPPVTNKSADESAERSVLLCETCSSQIDNPESMDPNHWRCLTDSMWTQEPAVQVMAARLLARLSAESWAQDQLEMLYLDEETQAWADAESSTTNDDEPESTTRDSNGAVLNGGDTVTLIKDLDVKGTGFTAKRGTAVRGISLTDNPEQIEGRVNGVRIVLLTKFLKKSS